MGTALGHVRLRSRTGFVAADYPTRSFRDLTELAIWQLQQGLHDRDVLGRLPICDHSPRRLLNTHIVLTETRPN